jgi:dTDP-4-dehydrorhamnose reductase
VCFRLGKLFGIPDVKKYKKLTEEIINKNIVQLDSIKFNPTSLNLVRTILEYELTTHSLFGIFNLCNSGAVSSYDYGIFISNLLGYKIQYDNIPRCNKFFDNYGKFLMSNNKLGLEAGILINDWKTDMEEYLKCLVLGS